MPIWETKVLLYWGLHSQHDLMLIPACIYTRFLMFVGEIFIEQNGRFCFTLASRKKTWGKKPKSDSCVGSPPKGREWLPTAIFLSGEFRRQRRLAGYSPWGRRESDTTEQLTLSLSSQTVSSSEIHTLCKVEKTLRLKLCFTFSCSISNDVQKSITYVCQRETSGVCLGIVRNCPTLSYFG